MKKNRHNIQLNEVVHQQDEIRLVNPIHNETINLGFNLQSLDRRHDAKICMIEINSEFSAIP